MNQEENLHCYKLLTPHPRLKAVAWLMVVLCVALFFLIAFLPWQQTARGHGRVVALSPNERQQNIIAPITGRIETWYVHDGSFVKAGQPIVKISDNDPQLLKRLNVEHSAVLARYNAVKEALETSLNNVDRQKKLLKQGISSKRKYEQSKLEFIQFKNALAQVKVDLTKINIKIARQENQLVSSPTAGTVIQRVTGQNSVLVKEGEKLAVLVPKTQSRAVELWIAGNDVPLIKTGQQVRLQFEGWPAIQFSGWPSVAVGTFGGHVKLVEPIDNGNGQFRILVVPNQNSHWPNSNFLRQGVKVNGWVLLNRVRLWYELWRVANGFPPAMEQTQKVINAHL